MSTSNNTGGQTVSLTTSVRTVTSTLPSSTATSTSVVTSSSVVVTSIPPSTFTPPPPSTSSSIPIPSSSVVVTSTYTPPATNPTQAPSVVIVTSTLPAPTSAPPPTTATSSSHTSTTTSSSPSALSASGSGSGGSGGLTTGAKIAIAVVIPVVVVAGLIIFGLWFWRKRKARKSNEELRKNEMAEYGFNPNSDPTLASAGVVGAAGVAGAAYGEDASDGPEDRSGYRGWGATSSNRKASTTMGSNGRPHGMTISDSGSQPGGYQHQGSSPATNPSDHYSGDPLVHGHPEHGGGVGALGAGAAGAGEAALVRNRSSHNGDIKRGPSNASSAYSNGPPHSEASSDVPGVPGHYYGSEVPYNEYNEAAPQHGPYGDGSYGGATGQPVIRDVQARRNPRIDRAPTMPQTQGGISQNF